MIVIWVSSRSARSARPPARNCSTDSRRCLTARCSTVSTSSSVSAWESSSSWFLTAERTVPSSRVRSLSLLFRAVFSAACKPLNSLVTRGVPDTPPGLPHGGVGLPLALLTRLFVMTMLAQVGKDSRLLALLLEALEGPLKALVIVDDDFRHLDLSPLSGPAGRNSVQSLMIGGGSGMGKGGGDGQMVRGSAGRGLQSGDRL